MKYDFMLDLETLGTTNNAAILSIGAVLFDINTGQSLKTFYQNVELQSCLDAGLEVTGSTCYWWLQQSEEARNALMKNKVDLDTALYKFSSFVESMKGKKRLWGNGVGFDNVILRNAYNASEIEWPFTYRDDRDVRTLVQIGKSLNLLENKISSIPKNLTKHNALDDAIHQVDYVSNIWKKLKGLK